ncbi:hypothetical protein LOZ86_13525 [Pectobacterium parvum]|uniref:Uncharacterized protein n=1 Tax=Pectobacterium parvum TaxID=2778550 RepID=A0ABW8FSI5_9GAMM|nr:MULTISPECIES: hypothetical protein [Pectobacterium]GKW40142.1 hypothetical protein PEC301879_00010 [Pectobacterium carotovorum subsp. carotovorum]KFX12598.1 hypothetical protein KP17_13460 [Pectobacterium parvum]MCU1801254.1 hypothetical protein [Pectobacterium parvum]UFK37987.1 hypothetical protein LOZ86_13525 [Pectobacterium parvum]UVD96164.1 hypothetical protein NV347_13950 [Pectobacterium parvum]
MFVSDILEANLLFAQTSKHAIATSEDTFKMALEKAKDSGQISRHEPSAKIEPQRSKAAQEFMDWISKEQYEATPAEEHMALDLKVQERIKEMAEQGQQLA